MLSTRLIYTILIFLGFILYLHFVFLESYSCHNFRGHKFISFCKYSLLVLVSVFLLLLLLLVVIKDYESAFDAV